MALNTTIFSGSGLADNEVDQSTMEIPEYLSYVMLCFVSLSIPMVIIPALYAIVFVVKNTRLQTNNNIFLINLLLTDIGFAVILWSTNGLLTILYLLGINVDPDCNLILIPVMILVVANKLMFIPLCVDRFIHIAYPFSYKRIVTTKAVMITIISLWIAAVVVTTFIYLNEPFEYIPSLGVCKPNQTNIPGLLILFLCFFIPIVLITVTSIYLRQRIIKSKNFFHSVKRNAAEERKSKRAGRLAEILQEQVKPTLSVFFVGGIDGVLDILTVVIAAVASFLSPSSTIAFIISAQFTGILIQYLQSANHALVYHGDIREKMTGCTCITMGKKRSKVIVLHREKSQDKQ